MKQLKKVKHSLEDRRRFVAGAALNMLNFMLEEGSLGMKSYEEIEFLLKEELEYCELFIRVINEGSNESEIEDM